MVVDDLLDTLDQYGYDAQAYADDLVIIIRGKHDRTLGDLMQRALKTTWEWCQQEGLNINPDKTSVVPFTNKRNYNLRPSMLNGKTIEFVKEVKYLGVILDQKLTWNSHIKRTIEKASSAQWTCNRLYGRTWGLSPQMIYWSYRTIIRPMITYAAFVWWPKTQEKRTQTNLTKLQRLACLGVTGAMRTCPTAAMEVILDLPPLALQVKKEALLEALRLQRSIHLLPGNLTGHLKILQDEGAEYDLPPVTDIMSLRFEFERPYKVIIKDRLEWTNEIPTFIEGALIWYTDGSKMDGKTGIGVTGPNYNLAKSLGTSPTIFQAEVHAIEVCALNNLKNGIKGAKIYILSDSQAALKALSSYTFESRLVWECYVSLVKLAKENTVTLMWVPGHQGIEGNERADELAKEGSAMPFIGPEPFCGLSKSHIKAAVRLWEDQQRTSTWQQTPGQRQAKKFIDISHKRSKQYLSLSKKDLKILTGLLTGHCPLKYHLKNMGIAEDDLCRLCEEEAETAEHILCNCKAAERRRLLHLGSPRMSPKEIRERAPIEVLRFFYSLKLN